ncbi:diaminopimelate epimerase [Sphingosinicella rhizophila]|uniref:Diaminopimelate epimerase n=1 Tax=Sphingosinicella rhizophila TaxID=3050082 RepID=A0ABU3Q2C2_9SPHN|nr:diaminopimelate epimerase [Sphingosinicella sp. GR2756]MDT9597570.1 diaminopimelate epimerase [Sphingosinicella sp. GR2756]
MKVPFQKMHGLGNDFVILDGRDTFLRMDGGRARALADRKTGIGCDQLVVLERSELADVRMRIWNADGGEVESCGNVSRCVALLLGGNHRIETKGGIIVASVDGDDAIVDMGVPSFAWQDIPLAYAMDTAAMPVGWESLQNPFAVNVGNPHIIFFVDDVEAVELDRLGPLIERDPLFPDRINVNVASIGDGFVRLRVWERGAGLTRACGTGACATAVAAISRKLMNGPVEVRLPGGALTIEWAQGTSIRMRGPGTFVFEGMIDLESLV